MPLFASFLLVVFPVRASQFSASCSGRAPVRTASLVESNLHHTRESREAIFSSLFVGGGVASPTHLNAGRMIFPSYIWILSILGSQLRLCLHACAGRRVAYISSGYLYILCFNRCRSPLLFEREFSFRFRRRRVFGNFFKSLSGIVYPQCFSSGQLLAACF